MSKITRTLQHATWEYDIETKEITMILKNNLGVPTTVVLNRLYTYSLGRFLIRSWQKMSQKQRKITNPLVTKNA